MTNRVYKTEGVVLKYRNYGEADRIVTLFTKHYGKLTAIAKGVRKITYHRSGSLEPGMHVILLLAKGHGWDVITQVHVYQGYVNLRSNLTRITQLNQILEIIDSLTAEHQEHELVYQSFIQLLHNLNNQNGSQRLAIVSATKNILEQLGFGIPQEDNEEALKNHLENIIERELRSKKMLS